MNRNTFCITLILILSGTLNLFSQELTFSDNDEPAITITPEKINLPQAEENIQSKEELIIIDEMNRLKSDQNVMNGEKILQLQKKLESINNRSVTIESDNSSPKLFSDEAIRNHLQNQTDAITKSELFSSPSAYIKSIATQTEQITAGINLTNGTIWVALAIGGGDVGVGASPDTLLLFKSVDNGSTYSLYSRLPLNVGNKVNYDDMDMEIVVANSSFKFIHLVFGYITDGFTGLYRTGIISYDIINNTAGGGSALTFPGHNFAGNKYSRPRIVSDNAFFHSAYLTIAVTQDSTDGVNNYYMTKFCRIFSPFSTNPAITYMPNSIYAPFPGFSTTAQTDIAYYNNGNSGGDSIIFVVSGIPGFFNLILTYKTNSNALANPVLSTILSQNFNNKQSARIASSGGQNHKKMMIVYIDDILGVNVFKTSDATNWSNSLILGGGGSLFQFKYPDITGRRNVDGKFYITNKAETPLTDIITSYVFDNLNLTSTTINHNNSGYKSFSAPKPSLRFMNNDSCLTFWPAYSSVYSSCGCNAVNVAFRAYIQGLYDPVTNSPKYDYSSIYLRQTIPPYAKVDSAFGYNATIYSFHNAGPGLYYISMNHRNSIETWYKQPHNLVSPGTTTLNMYQNASDAYGSNQAQVDNSPVTFAIYSGDVNQDGIIDAADLSAVENDVAISLSGYVVTDLNGDDFADASDLSIVENNAALGISVITP